MHEPWNSKLTHDLYNNNSPAATQYQQANARPRNCLETAKLSQQQRIRVLTWIN